jgi:phenylacetate-CoA ligase
MTHSNNKLWAAPDVAASWGWSRDELAAWQLEQFNTQLAHILPANRFYRAKFSSELPRLTHLDQLADLPLTSKQELVDSAAADPAGISAHHTYAASSYSRLHRTSGTAGRPLLVLDTSADWQWWSSTWQHVLQAAEVTTADRVFLAFSFGPFIGFWSAHQACVDRGATVIPGGGLSSLARSRVHAPNSGQRGVLYSLLRLAFGGSRAPGKLVARPNRCQAFDRGR